MAVTGDTRVRCRVAVMDVPFPEGVAGFLERESTYRILEVPYVDDIGGDGVALACGECTDADMRNLWGDDVWYLQHCSGRVSYVGDAVPPQSMPLVPPIGDTPGDPTQWLELTPGPQGDQDMYELPPGPWVYPSPGYLRLVYRAHARAEVVDNFLDTTLLMDRKTSLRTYLNANPLLRDWVVDPQIYPDRVCDRYE